MPKIILASILVFLFILPYKVVAGSMSKSGHISHGQGKPMPPCKVVAGSMSKSGHIAHGQGNPIPVDLKADPGRKRARALCSGIIVVPSIGGNFEFFKRKIDGGRSRLFNVHGAGICAGI